MQIELLGVGCSKHRQVRAHLKKALEGLRLAIPIIEVDDVQRFIEQGITLIPCLRINGEVISRGRVPSIEELSEALRLRQAMEK